MGQLGSKMRQLGVLRGQLGAKMGLLDSWAMLKVLTSEQRVLKSVTLVPSAL